MTSKAPEITTLKQLCAELKLDPRECRERLRAAVHDAKKFPELAKAPVEPPLADPIATTIMNKVKLLSESDKELLVDFVELLVAKSRR